MTGFTLGGGSGATLGGDSGGTLGTLQDAYHIGGQRIPSQPEEISTHDRLTLTFRVQTAVLLNRLRQAKPNEGQVTTLQSDDGGFSAVDRAAGANTFDISPPAVREPLRQPGEFHVGRYEEELISPRIEEWTVTLELLRDANREDTPSIDQVPGGSEWGFDTRFGQIAAEADAEFLGLGADGVERFSVRSRLTFEQAHVFEAALSRLGGVRIRQVPDASNVAVDDTSDDANTVEVTAPTGEEVEDGEYVVLAWESRRLNNAYQFVEFEIAREN